MTGAASQKAPEVAALEELLDVQEECLLEQSERLTRVMEEVRAEKEAATLAQARLQNILDNVRDIIFVLDSAGTFTDLNAAFERLLGLSAAEWIGKPFLPLIHPEDAQHTLELFFSALRGEGPPATPIRVLHRSGAFVPLEVKPTDLRSGDAIVGVMGIARDISDRGDAAKALKRSEAITRAIMNDAADAIITTDGRGRIRSWNRAAERLFGYTALEAMALTADEILPDRIELFGAAAMALNARRKDGSTFPVELSMSEVTLEEELLYASIVRDITERTRVEAELASLHSNLLEASRQAGMAEVAAGVLHNVGNVLNSVNVSASVIAETCRRSKAPGLGKAVELMQAHGTDLGAFLSRDEKGARIPGYLASLAKRLEEEREGLTEEATKLTRDVEHIKAIVDMHQSYAKVSGVTEPVTVKELAESALQMARSGFERHGISVVREYAELPAVMLEKQKVLQILVNLIRNAKQAFADGSADDKRVVVRLARSEGGALRVEVEDNGAGVDSRHMPRLFTHGFTTKKDGHGFGLHSAALSAKEMGGSLTATSAGPGRGALFALELPFKPAREAA